MSDLIGTTIAWLASTGAPNWLVILALLTHPSVWSDAALKRLRPLLDRWVPKSTGKNADAATGAGGKK